MQITVTLTIAELIALPGEAVIRLIEQANADQHFTQAVYDAESTSKARWPVLNTLRSRLKSTL